MTSGVGRCSDGGGGGGGDVGGRGGVAVPGTKTAAARFWLSQKRSVEGPAVECKLGVSVILG